MVIKRFQLDRTNFIWHGLPGFGILTSSMDVNYKQVEVHAVTILSWGYRYSLA